MLTSISLSALLPFLLSASPALAQTSLSSLTAQWGLSANTFTFNMPDSTLNSDDAQKFVRSNWDLAGKIDWGGNNIVFSPDPSTSSSTLVRRASTKTSTSSSAQTSGSSSTTTQAVSSPASTDLNGESAVLRIGYPQGSYSKKTGGTQFYAAPLNATGSSSVSGNTSTDGQYERMLLAYDVWFPSGYAWNMGGKLPGLRGGSDTHGCSGGNETDGSSCFSTRLMWRSGGAGEVYAYIPTSQKNFCKTSQVTCNSDYGTSLARGSFSFSTGKWQTIWLLVVLNQNGVANGVVELYYNGVAAMTFQNLEIRSSTSLASIGGMFFSTFFGGDDSTWATPTDQYTYFRNLQLYAGYGAANGTGAAISGAGAVADASGGMGFITALGALGVVMIWGLGRVF